MLQAAVRLRSVGVPVDVLDGLQHALPPTCARISVQYHVCGWRARSDCGPTGLTTWLLATHTPQRPSLKPSWNNLKLRAYMRHSDVEFAFMQSSFWPASPQNSPRERDGPEAVLQVAGPHNNPSGALLFIIVQTLLT